MLDYERDNVKVCQVKVSQSQSLNHSALSSNGLFTPLTLWRLSVSLRPLVQSLESFPASGAPWSSAIPPSLRRGRVNNNNVKVAIVFKNIKIGYEVVGIFQNLVGSFFLFKFVTSRFWLRAKLTCFVHCFTRR